MSFNFSPKIVTNGLIFSFDPANRKSFVSGSTTATDIKSSTLLTFKNKIYGGGTGDIVTVISPTFDTNNSGTIFFNRGGDLSGDGVYLPTGETLTNLTSQVSLSIWFKKPISQSSYQILAGKGFSSLQGQSYTIYTQYNVLYNYINAGGSGVVISTTYNHNVWNNVVLTYNGSIVCVYLNGELKSSNPKSGAMINTQPFNIGCQNNAGYFPSTALAKTSEFYSGYISNVMIYNKGLTQQEVLQNYNALKPRFGL